MASMVVSDLRIIGQVGTTIGLGLMFDTLVGPLVHDTLHRRPARTLVLVADQGATAAGQHDAPDHRAPPAGSFPPAGRGGGRQDGAGRRRGEDSPVAEIPVWVVARPTTANDVASIVRWSAAGTRSQWSRGRP